MTRLGIFLAKRSINKSEVSRKTGISKARLSQLTLNHTAHLRVDELYLIALAIKVDPAEILMDICTDLQIAEETTSI